MCVLHQINIGGGGGDERYSDAECAHEVLGIDGCGQPGRTEAICSSIYACRCGDGGTTEIGRTAVGAAITTTNAGHILEAHVLVIPRWAPSELRVTALRRPSTASARGHTHDHLFPVSFDVLSLCICSCVHFGYSVAVLRSVGEACLFV